MPSSPRKLISASMYRRSRASTGKTRSTRCSNWAPFHWTRAASTSPSNAPGNNLPYARPSDRLVEGTMMNIRTIIFAGVLGLPLSVGSALAAETGNALVNAAKLGDRAAVLSLLKGPAKDDVAGPHGVSALIWAAHRNDLPMVDLLLSVGVNIKGANEFGATALYAAAAHSDPALA